MDMKTYEGCTSRKPGIDIEDNLPTRYAAIVITDGVHRDRGRCVSAQACDRRNLICWKQIHLKHHFVCPTELSSNLASRVGRCVEVDIVAIRISEKPVCGLNPCRIRRRN